jgi:hypothetical protein
MRKPAAAPNLPGGDPERDAAHGGAATGQRLRP